MRVVILGKSGQVGRALASLAWPGPFAVTCLGRNDCDLTDAAAVRSAVLEREPDLVINAAAYTAVDRAESEVDLAMNVNGEGPAELARACAEAGSALVHLSTDYVFDGAKSSAYVEDDPVCPLSVYGASKAAGEVAIRVHLKKHAIVRTSWVFAPNGANFVRTMLRQAQTRPELRVVGDQIGAPTSAGDIGRAILRIADRVRRGAGVWGTFHFTSSSPTSWYGFAQSIFAEAGLADRVTLTPIATSEYPAAAARPLNSVLDCSRIRSAYGIRQPSWRVALADVLREIGRGGGEESER